MAVEEEEPNADGQAGRKGGDQKQTPRRGLCVDESTKEDRRRRRRRRSGGDANGVCMWIKRKGKGKLLREGKTAMMRRIHTCMSYE